jgi:hypothetical protein
MAAARARDRLSQGSTFGSGGVYGRWVHTISSRRPFGGASATRKHREWLTGGRELSAGCEVSMLPNTARGGWHQWQFSSAECETNDLGSMVVHILGEVCGQDGTMPEQFPHRPDVDPVLEQVRRE